MQNVKSHTRRRESAPWDGKRSERAPFDSAEKGCLPSTSEKRMEEGSNTVRRRIVGALGRGSPERLSALPRGRRPPLAQGLQGRRRAAPGQGQVSLLGGKARPAGHGGGGAGAAPLARAAEGAEGRVLDGGLVVVGQGQLNQAVEVLEHLWIALDRRLPILVDAPFQLRLGVGDLARVRRLSVVAERVGRDAIDVLGVGRLAPLRQEAEVLEDVVLGVSPHPRAGNQSARPVGEEDQRPARAGSGGRGIPTGCRCISTASCEIRPA